MGEDNRKPGVGGPCFPKSRRSPPTPAAGRMRMVEGGAVPRAGPGGRPDGIPWRRRGGDGSREDIWRLGDEGGDGYLANDDDPEDEEDDENGDDDPDDDEDDEEDDEEDAEGWDDPGGDDDDEDDEEEDEEEE